MHRPYVNFKNSRLGKRIDYDRSYGYQCVDLIKLYLEFLGFGEIDSLGNAKEVPKASLFAKGRERFEGMSDLMQGDIIVRTRDTYGHIGIVDRIVNGKVYVLEQNGSGKDSGSGLWANVIRVQLYPKTRYDVILRCPKIFQNLEEERKFVNAKIAQLKEEFRITSDYLASTRAVG